MTRSRSITFLASAAALLAVLSVTGCGGGGNAGGSPAPPKTKDGRLATVGIANEGLGKILVNSQARTLYLFQKDSGTMSECTGACAVNWPPLRASGAPLVGSGANASMIGTTARSDGRPQITYNGHPLYLIVKDRTPGDTNGEGLTAFGGSWFAVSPAGNQVSAKAPSPGNGYGY
jgi:predicted lipoprotein with Yx(FWY)xxD motif